MPARAGHNRFRLLTLSAALGAVLAGGCGSAPRLESRAAPGGESPTRMVMEGDWDDVEVAVRYGLARSELSLLSVTDAPLSKEFRLRSSRDEPASLSASREAPGPDPVPIRMEARVGRFGDPAREHALLHRVNRRLGQLRGVDIAPAHD